MMGHRNRFMSRRRALSVGVGAFGLTLPGLLQARSASSSSPRAKSVIILYLSGGPSQLDMWDMKPDAPAEVRGPYYPIASSLPGLDVSELSVE